MRRPMYAVKVAGHTHGAADIYWKNPGQTRRCLFDSKAEAAELAEREGGYVVEVKTRNGRS